MKEILIWFMTANYYLMAIGKGGYSRLNHVSYSNQEKQQSDFERRGGGAQRESIPVNKENRTSLARSHNLVKPGCYAYEGRGWTSIISNLDP